MFDHLYLDNYGMKLCVINEFSIAVYLYFTAATVRFEHEAYNVNEDDEKLEPVLVLSNPSSSVITVQVFSTDGSATGKQLTISCTIIEQLL